MVSEISFEFPKDAELYVLLCCQYCQFCQKGDNEELLLLCDVCDKGYHTYCHKPQISTIPEGDWYCPSCIAKVIEPALKSRQTIDLSNDSVLVYSMHSRVFS